MTKFINRLDNNTIAYNQLTGKNSGIVFLSGFNSDMQGKKALYLEKWAKENNHSFLRFDYSGHGQSSGTIETTCFSDWYQDAEYLINKLTQDKQILIGSSMGAWIMLMLVKQIPQKISAIIGLAPAPDFPKLLILFFFIISCRCFSSFFEGENTFGIFGLPFHFLRLLLSKFHFPPKGCSPSIRISNFFLIFLYINCFQSKRNS